MAGGPDAAFAGDLFAALGRITTRAVMGGPCLHADGRIFAILDREALL